MRMSILNNHVTTPQLYAPDLSALFAAATEVRVDSTDSLREGERHTVIITLVMPSPTALRTVMDKAQQGGTWDCWYRNEPYSLFINGIEADRDRFMAASDCKGVVLTGELLYRAKLSKHPVMQIRQRNKGRK